MNPILPKKHFVPDVEAREMPDGRLYIYGSYDISGKMDYCSEVLHVFSTDDMKNWTDHGICFQGSDVSWAKTGSMLFAPDCIYHKGKYYLYFCMSGCEEGVAEADTPWGPFTNPRPIVGADGDSIDPAVFVDDDGQAYYYWGQFQLRAAKLKDDMCTLDLSTLTENLIDEKGFGFHEGASVRKRNGRYYLVYTDISRGRATCMGYAVSRTPLGPFEYKGVIIDNTGCDPETWNNHGCIASYKNQWYVFYHRSSQQSRYNRRVCVETIDFQEDGTIQEVLCTTQGSGKPIPVRKGLAAADTCRIGGFSPYGLEGYAYLAPDPQDSDEEVLCNVRDNGWAAYRYVEFEENISEMSINLESTGSGRIELWADHQLAGVVSVSDTAGSRRCFKGKMSRLSGTYTLYLEWKMEAGVTAAIKKIEFI